MNVMRYTVLDRRGGISFIAACQALPAIVAACSQNPTTVDDFLAFLAHYDAPLSDYVLNALAIFDEHNADGNYAAIHEAIRFAPAVELPVFRIVDDLTRQTALHPIKAGAILFNLTQKRIVQIQNSYAEIARAGRVRIQDPTLSRPRLLPYRLSGEWSIVP